MYAGVPITAPATVNVEDACSTLRRASLAVAAARGAGLGERSASGGSASSRFFASPQSITTVSPYSPIRMFAGLRSRWITRWLCA